MQQSVPGSESWCGSAVVSFLVESTTAADVGAVTAVVDEYLM